MELLKNLDENYLLDDQFDISKFLLTKNINQIQDYERDLVLLQHNISIKTVNDIYNNYNNFINTSTLLLNDKLYLSLLDEQLDQFKFKLQVG